MTVNHNLYEQDFHAWTEEQARLLRGGRLADIDTEHSVRTPFPWLMP